MKAVVEKLCDYCGQTFKTTRSRQRFCWPGCHIAYSNRKYLAKQVEREEKALTFPVAVYDRWVAGEITFREALALSEDGKGEPYPPYRPRAGEAEASAGGGNGCPHRINRQQEGVENMAQAIARWLKG